MKYDYDVAIIGGGINGCGIAAEASQRGLRCILLEKDDLASKTSSNSSGLIHGGLRYLEQYNFSLVKKSLDERQVLLKIAPHLVRPLAFILPYDQHMRPTWLIRTGLMIYDYISLKNRLPRSRFIRRRRHQEWFEPLKEHYQKGFVYYDAKTHDARLCIENALQACHFGADIQTRSKVTKAVSHNEGWKIDYDHGGRIHSITARCIVNAGGPWVNAVHDLLGKPKQQNIALVKGSHILIPANTSADHAYLLQHIDKRIIFVAPYHGYTMIGTTDVPIENLDQPPTIDDEEIHYLLSIYNYYFNQQLKPSDIVHSWSGVRPLLQQKESLAQQLTRDYSINIAEQPSLLVTIYGGKITTFRQLSKKVVDKLSPHFSQIIPSKSHLTKLPGGHLFDQVDFEKQHAWIPENTLRRTMHSYGSRVLSLFDNCRSIEALGVNFGHGLFQKEVEWLMDQEWANTAEDILWRRTKLGLLFNEQQTKQLQQWISARTA